MEDVTVSQLDNMDYMGNYVFLLHVATGSKCVLFLGDAVKFWRGFSVDRDSLIAMGGSLFLVVLIMIGARFVGR